MIHDDGHPCYITWSADINHLAKSYTFIAFHCKWEVVLILYDRAVVLDNICCMKIAVLQRCSYLNVCWMPVEDDQPFRQCCCLYDCLLNTIVMLAMLYHTATSSPFTHIHMLDINMSQTSTKSTPGLLLESSATAIDPSTIHRSYLTID